MDGTNKNALRGYETTGMPLEPGTATSQDSGPDSRLVSVASANPSLGHLLLQAALRYAELGYPVFPLAVGTKEPSTPHGLHDATTSEAAIEDWCRAFPTANIGLNCRDLLVVDVDPGSTWLEDDDRMRDLLRGPCAMTPRGGRHFVYRLPAGKSWKNTAGKIAQNTDTRTTGGYIVVAPSVVNGVAYRWVPGCELDCEPSRLPEPPAWLVALMDERASNDAPATAGHLAATLGGIIPNGQRNHALASLAGSMRRVGMGEAEIRAALTVTNELRCKPPVPQSEVNKVAWSIARKEPDQVAQAIVEDRWAQVFGGAGGDGANALEIKPSYVSLRTLIETNPTMRPVVIDGLIRRGETLNIIAPSKIGKSWLVNGIALCKAAGSPVLGMFPATPGRVLILDNELHPETSSSRFQQLVESYGFADSVIDNVCIENLRGRLVDIHSMASYFRQLPQGEFDLIIIDAFYRTLPNGVEENSNAGITAIYNAIDRYAGHLDCGFALIHHASKGNQSSKAVTDVGSGAGSQSRAADTHLVLRAHEEPGVCVVDAALRSFAPLEPFCLRWSFPRWFPDLTCDPTALRSERPRKAKAAKPQAVDFSVSDFVDAFVREEPRDRSAIVADAINSGLSKNKAIELLQQSKAAGLTFCLTTAANKPQKFSILPPH